MKKEKETEAKEVVTEVKEKKTRVPYEDSDIVTFRDTSVCPDGYEETVLDEDVAKLGLKKGERVFTPTMDELKRRGRA